MEKDLIQLELMLAVMERRIKQLPVEQQKEIQFISSEFEKTYNKFKDEPMVVLGMSMFFNTTMFERAKNEAS